MKEKLNIALYDLSDAIGLFFFFFLVYHMEDSIR